MLNTNRLKTKLLPREHTGRLRPHHHTSYGSLFLVLIMVSIPLLILGHAKAATSGAGDYQVFAVVPAQVSKVAPVITSPTSGQTFTTLDPIKVEGTCSPNTLVKLYKDEVMAGSVLCGRSNFSIDAMLFLGTNSLVARAYNVDNVPGPDSVPVGVNLLLPGTTLASFPASPSSAPAGQFYITSDSEYQGSNPGTTMSWPLTLVGGKAPYAISIEWGDGQSDLISRPAAANFTISHAYSRAASYNGDYTITVKASDQNNNQSYLQLVAIVNGKSAVVSTTTNTTTTNTHSLRTTIIIAWQILGILALIVIAFWIGEKRQLLLLVHNRHITGAS